MRKMLIVFGLAVFTFCGLMAMVDMGKSSAAASPKVSPVSTPAQLTKSKQCTAVLKKNPGDAWRHFRIDGDFMTVDVGPGFYGGAFEDKQAMTALFRCVGTEGRMDSTIGYIDYLDWRTHKEVAIWTPDLGLDIKD